MTNARTKFYSYYTEIASSQAREDKNDAIYELGNELETVLGPAKLISMTSASCNGVIVTTIAYEEEQTQEDDSDQ